MITGNAIVFDDNATTITTATKTNVRSHYHKPQINEHRAQAPAPEILQP